LNENEKYYDLLNKAGLWRSLLATFILRKFHQD
jgi:hypothetical protein